MNCLIPEIPYRLDHLKSEISHWTEFTKMEEYKEFYNNYFNAKNIEERKVVGAFIKYLNRATGDCYCVNMGEPAESYYVSKVHFTAPGGVYYKLHINEYRAIHYSTVPCKKSIFRGTQIVDFEERSVAILTTLPLTPYQIKVTSYAFRADALRKEFENLCAIDDHPFAVKALVYLEFNVGGAPFGALVEEYYPEGDLHYYLQRYPSLPEEIEHYLCDQLIRALFETHRRDVIHGDIKPSNFAISIDLDTGLPMVKIIDWEMMVKSNASSAEKNKKFGTLRFNSPEFCDAYASMIASAKGKFFELSPERQKTLEGLFLPGLITKAFDVWAFGLVLFKVCYRYSFVDDAITYEKTRSYRELSKLERRNIIRSLPQDWIDNRFLKNRSERDEIIRSLLMVEPLQRATMEKAMKKWNAHCKKLSSQNNSVALSVDMV